MKTDWSNYTITYDGTDYGVYYRDGINLVACETYVPNSPTTDISCNNYKHGRPCDKRRRLEYRYCIGNLFCWDCSVCFRC